MNIMTMGNAGCFECNFLLQGIGEYGFELGIPREQRSRPEVQEALKQCGIGNQVVFLELLLFQRAKKDKK